MAEVADYLVSTSGQMSLPAAVRRRWGLGAGGRVCVVDLGQAVVILPDPDAVSSLLDGALPADEHLAFVRDLDDPDLATT